MAFIPEWHWHIPSLCPCFDTIAFFPARHLSISESWHFAGLVFPSPVIPQVTTGKATEAPEFCGGSGAILVSPCGFFKRTPLRCAVRWSFIHSHIQRRAELLHVGDTMRDKTQTCPFGFYFLLWEEADN